jgi:hypothetical protein
MTSIDNRNALSARALRHNSVAFGVADLGSLPTDDFLLPAGTTNRLRYGVSVALPLSPAVLDTLPDHPNRLYEHHYRQVNFALDRLGLALAQQIGRLGHSALPIPASQIVDWKDQRGHLSHKRVAVGAGVGWLGRNNLLVTPTHGARVRLVTVMTDLPLPTDSPLDHYCGDCQHPGLPGARNPRAAERVRPLGLLRDAQGVSASTLRRAVHLRPVRPGLRRLERR